MIRIRWFVLFVFFLTACAASPTSPTQLPETKIAAAPLAEASQAAPGALALQRGEMFSGSGNCAICHTAMQDDVKDVSTDRLWRATMMANSARDPYWQAQVRSEVLTHPAYQAVIEDKCATCHMPMARFTTLRDGEKAAVFAPGFADPSHALHPLAMDGVSCNLCHQIQDENLGQEVSFSGGYSIDTTQPQGQRQAFGPYVIEPAQAAVMKSVSGFEPVQGKHIEAAELCGTCHGLFTPFVDRQGEIAGEFPEQMVYAEWLHSAYAQDEQAKSCQSCHMPEAQGGVVLSTTGGPARIPFYKHYFVGGNTYLPELFQKYGDELGVTASTDQYQTTIANAAQQMQRLTARLVIENARLENDQVLAGVRVENLTGHKFPSGFPSRRAWLHITLIDASGEVVFESGAPKVDGSIEGNDQDESPTGVEPHYTQIEVPSQVQIYEGVMVDTDGQPTTVLLKGSGYVKDNRLLPTGFDKHTAPQEIAVWGEAAQDADFAAAGDTLALAISAGSAQGPFTLRVELLYQSIAFRWVQNLSAFSAPETLRFTQYYTTQPNLPLPVTKTEVQVTAK